MKKPKNLGLGAVEPRTVEGTMNADGVLVADGVYYRNADGDLKRETPYDIPLRDHLAGFALVASSIACSSEQFLADAETIAIMAYNYADAMLKVRGGE